VEVSSKICVFVHNDAFTTKYPTYSAVRNLVVVDNFVYFKGTPTPCVSLIIFHTLPSTLAHPGRVSVDATRWLRRRAEILPTAATGRPVSTVLYHSSSRLILLRPHNTRTNNPQTGSSHYFTRGFIFHCLPDKRSKYLISRCNKQDAQVKQVLIV